MNAPGIGENGRGKAEADHVGERIHLAAEIAGGVGHARDAAIEAIEKNGGPNSLRGYAEMIVGAGHARGNQQRPAKCTQNGDVSQEDVARGKERWQRIGGAARTTLGGSRIDQPIFKTHCDPPVAAGTRRAITLDPAETRMPG